MEKRLWTHIQSVKDESPLVHNITNYVVMNNSANALLAVGASPIMSHSPEEVEEIVSICQALVINIGTLSAAWLEGMHQAATKANYLGKPWVLDPVGAGATGYRNTALSGLLELRPTVIRGNASEIMALASHNYIQTKGVDSTAASNEAVDAAHSLNHIYGSIVCVSGAEDIIVGADRTAIISNGAELMTKVTGLGCSASAICGAFAGVIEDKFEAVVAAMAYFSLAGELATAKSHGPGSLQVNLLDILYTMGEDEFLTLCRIK